MVFRGGAVAFPNETVAPQMKKQIRNNFDDGLYEYRTGTKYLRECKLDRYIYRFKKAGSDICFCSQNTNNLYNQLKN